jgi:hypothetical protein
MPASLQALSQRFARHTCQSRFVPRDGVWVRVGGGLARRREHERVVGRPAGGAAQLGEVGCERCEQTDGAALVVLGALDRSVGAGGALDGDRGVADVAPAQRAQLAGAQAGVGEHGDDRGVALALERAAFVGDDVAGDAHAASADALGDVDVHRPAEDGADVLDGGGSEWRDAVAVLDEWGAYERERVAGDRL